MRPISTYIKIACWIALSFCVVLASLAQTAFAELNPKAFFSDTVYDFGTVGQGAIVERDFQIENRGNSDLYIRKIYAACGCTAAVLTSDIVPVGGKTSIKIQLDTTGFQGYKVKTVRVYTNDPETASAVLTMKGNIKPDIKVGPAALNFGVVFKGSAPTLTTTISSEEPGFQVLAVKPRSDKLDVKTQDITDDGATGKSIAVSLHPDIPVGVYRSRLSVETNSKKSPVMTVPIFAQVRGDLILSDSVVSFGLIEGPLKKALVQEVILENTAPRAIKVLSTRADHQNIQAQVTELEPGKRFKVTVTLLEGTSGAVRARVYIETDHPDAEQRDVPLSVYAIVARAGE